MNEFYEQARAKLEAGKKESCGRYGDAMKKDVADALLDFCRQDEEFAQAVAQGGSFADCMKDVASGVHDASISDMKAFGLAVGFFFKGATISVKMTINVNGAQEEQQKEMDWNEQEPKGQERTTPQAAVIDLSAFF